MWKHFVQFIALFSFLFSWYIALMDTLALGQYYSTDPLVTPQLHRELTHSMPQNTLTNMLGRELHSLIGTAKAVVKSIIG
ncbi:MAG: hypothetical protein C4B59_01975 [Candidatus Methanogaster sp.]|uniref:Uncharacterized protein n=1 Tax=Candidatus Methanogaster sp. TaxID=3386292 RepID=A0AC61L6F9_9EURY|nr:MAG: hypothetical protein C4B59_01975 [ANME-2 cluster archaeon]